MDTVIDKEQEKAAKDRTITVSVNFKPVVFNVREATGLEIKQAAMAQAVNIQPDFVLFLEKGNGRRDPIGDDETVKLHPGQKFEAVPGDDNS